MRLRRYLGWDLSPEERRRRFARVVSAVLWLFAFGAAIAVVQVGRALRSGKVWVNYRGDAITATAMWRELVVFAVLAIMCALMAWYWSRRGRS